MNRFYLLSLLLVVQFGLASTSHGSHVRTTSQEKNMKISNNTGSRRNSGTSTKTRHTAKGLNKTHDSVSLTNDAKLGLGNRRSQAASPKPAASPVKPAPTTDSKSEKDTNKTDSKSATAGAKTNPKTTTKPASDKAAPAGSTTPNKPEEVPKCGSPWLKLFTNDTSALKPTPYTKLGTDMCNREGRGSTESCCTDEMYGKLKEFYSADIEHHQNTRLVTLEVDHYVNYVVNHKFRSVLQESRLLLNSGTKLAPDAKISIAKLANGIFSESDLVSLKISARTCWEYLAKSVGAHYCSLCDAGMSSRMFPSADKIVIGPNNLRVHAKFCGYYENVFSRFLDYAQDLVHLIRTKDPSFVVKATLEKLSIPQYRLMIAQNNKCKKSLKHCMSEVLLQNYNISLVTNIENDSLPFLREVGRGMIKNFNSGEHMGPNEKKIFEEMGGAPKSRLRRLDLARETQQTVKATPTPKTTPASADTKKAETTPTPAATKKTETTPASDTTETDPKKPAISYPISLETKGFSLMWTDFAKYRKFHYSLRDTGDTYSYLLSPHDSTLPGLSLNGFSLFRTSRACPLARVFGGVVRVKKNNRAGDPFVERRGICTMLGSSCCTETTFVNYRDTWNMNKIYLSEYYKWSAWVKRYFTGSFFRFSFEKKPKYVKKCQNPITKPICNKKYEDLKSAVKIARKRYRVGIDGYKKCINTINSYRTKMFCASCDASMKKHLNASDTHRYVYVKKNEMAPLVNDCWVWLEYEFGPLERLWKKYYEYAKEIDPAADLNLRMTTDTFGMARPDITRCIAHMRAPHTAKFTALGETECKNVGKFLSSWIFFMPNHIRIQDDL